MGGTTNEKQLGEKLQLARRRAGFTQQELCHKAGLSYSTLAKIERGAIKSPSAFTVAAIAEATNTPLDDLLGIKSVRTSAPSTPKKTSKTGVKFVYFDVNGVLVRFYQKAFAEIARHSGKSADAVETLFWRHNDAVNRGTMALKDFNTKLGKELDVEDFNWQKFYMENVEPMPGINKLVDWVSTYYEVGLLSNNMPGFIDELLSRQSIPNVSYTSVVDSSKIGSTKPEPRIYEVAEQLSAVKAKEILFIDDSRFNLTAADKRGWHVLWFNDYDPEESISRAKKALEY